MEKFIENLLNQNSKKYFLLTVYNILAVILYIILFSFCYNVLALVFNFITHGEYVTSLYKIIWSFDSLFITYNWKSILFFVILFWLHFLLRVRLFVWYKNNDFLFPNTYKKIKNIVFILFGIFCSTSVGLLWSYLLHRFILQDPEVWTWTYFILEIHNLFWNSFFFFLEFYSWRASVLFHSFFSLLFVLCVVIFYRHKNLQRKNNFEKI